MLIPLFSNKIVIPKYKKEITEHVHYQLGIILKIGDNLHIGGQSPYISCIQTMAQFTQIPTQINVTRFGDCLPIWRKPCLLIGRQSLNRETRQIITKFQTGWRSLFLIIEHNYRDQIRGHQPYSGLILSVVSQNFTVAITYKNRFCYLVH